MPDLNLDAEEQDILDSYERGEWQSVPNVEQELKRYQQIAQAQFGTPILMTPEELIQVGEILKGHLHYDYSPPAAQSIKSLLDKIEAAIQNLAVAN